MQLIEKISFCFNYQEIVHLWKTFCLSMLDQSCAVLGGMITTKYKKILNALNKTLLNLSFRE